MAGYLCQILLDRSKECSNLSVTVQLQFRYSYIRMHETPGIEENCLQHLWIHTSISVVVINEITLFVLIKDLTFLYLKLQCNQ